MASLSAARSPMFSSTRASSTSGPKTSQLMRNGGTSIGCSGNSRLTGGEYYQGQGVGIHSTTGLGWVQGLFACFWHLLFIWTSLLTMYSVGMTGMSRRVSGKSLVLGLPRHYGKQFVSPDRGETISMGRIG